MRKYTELDAHRRQLMDFPMRNLGLVVCFFALLKPSLFDLNSTVTLACRLASVAVFAWMLYRYVSSKTKLSTPLVLFVLFRVSFLLPTLANNGDVLNWGYTTLGQVALFALIEWETRKGGNRALDCFKMLRSLLAAYLVANCLMIVFDFGSVQRLQSDGEITTWYLLGIRTRVTDCFFPALMISLIVDRLKGKQIGFLTLAILFVGIVQISLLEVTTAFAGLAIFAVAFAVTTLSQTMNARLSVRAIIVIGLAITILVVGFRIQEHFAEFLATVLDKNATLTGRTELWDSAFGIIGSSPVFGYGINDSVGAFVPWRGMYWQVHNQWLQLLYDGGIVAASLFVMFICAAGRNLEKSRELDKVIIPAKSTLLAFMVMMVSEIYTYNMGLFFLVPFTMAALPNFAISHDSETAKNRAELA